MKTVAVDLGIESGDAVTWHESLLKVRASFEELDIVDVSDLASLSSICESDQAFLPESLVAFENLRMSADYSEIRAEVIVLWGREDLSGSFRTVDRDESFRVGVLAILDFVASRNPVALVQNVTPHQSSSYLLWRIFSWLSIPTLFFQPCSVAPSMFPRECLASFLDFQQVDSPTPALSEQIIARAKESLEALVERTPPVYMSRQAERHRAATSFRGRLRAVVATLRFVFATNFRAIPVQAFSGHSKKPLALYRLLYVWFMRSQSRFLRKRFYEEKRHLNYSTSYCLFAMHYEPERTAFPEGKPFGSQLEAIIAVRASLPQDLKLYVKEHASQVSSALRGYSARSATLYKALARMPGVELIGEDVHSAEVLQNSACVFTFTGTIGIEAALRGIRVGYLGNPWWQGMPGTLAVRVADDIPAVLDAPTSDQPAIFDFVAARIGESGILGGASESSAQLVQRFGGLPEGFCAAAISELTHVLEVFLRKSLGTERTESEKRP